MAHDDNAHDDDTPALSPGSQAMMFVPTRQPDATLRATEEEVLGLVRGKVKADSVDFKLQVGTLLEAGYTCGEIARKLRVHVSSVFAAEADPMVGKMAARGRERRARITREAHQDYTKRALDALIDLAEDPSVAPKDRVKAAETIVKTSPDSAGSDDSGGSGHTFIQNNFQTRVLEVLNRPQETIDIE